MQAAAQDPRARFSWGQAGGFGGGDSGGRILLLRLREHNKLAATLHRDWSINLGTAGTAAAMYPAKFSFDVTATPSCANDFVIYPINAKGSSTQPNLVAFNNLYSGTAGSIGICNRTPSGSDNGVAATVLWSYNVQSISGGGAVTTSPTLSYDPLSPGGTNTGTKVAFVESASGNPAHFHVLAWKSGDGKNNSNLQSVFPPVTISSFVSAAPAVGSGTATDLPLGASAIGTVTLSSAFVDYVRDVAYIGNDLGQLYRIKDVFCTSVNSDCTGAPQPAPSLDTTWGSGGVVGVCSGTLTAPVLDFVTLNVYVGCSDGKLYGFNSIGSPLAGSPVVVGSVVGNGPAAGSVVDPPIVDGVNAYVYAFAGDSTSGNDVAVQTKVDMSSSVTVTLGPGGGFKMHAGAFNDAYYSGSGTPFLYVPSYNGGSTHTFIYWIGFTGSLMNSTYTGKTNTPVTSSECSPLTEFLNGTDHLFLGQMSPGSEVQVYPITTANPGTPTSATAPGGTSGIIVDNSSASTQASSIYFANLASTACGAGGTGMCAVKLTQSGLQ